MPEQYAYVPAALPLLAAILLVLAALGGATLAGLHLRSRQTLPPMPLALLHGSLGAVGVAVLAIALIYAGLNTLTLAALVLFLASAAGGLYQLINFRLREKPLSTPIVLIHGLVSIVALVFCFYVVFIVGLQITPFLTPPPA